MKKISVIVPCYNEQAVLPEFYKNMNSIMSQIENVNWELIFIDDGSNDDTLKTIRQFHDGDKTVRYVSFSRNFGKEAGLLAGLSYATGDYVALIDADLQHPPKLLLEMYAHLKSGEWDVVAVRRLSRKGEPTIRSFLARQFYKLINLLSDTEIIDGAQDFRMMTRQVVASILALPEYNRFSKGLFGWVGFRTKWLEHENAERVAGKSKWSLGKLILYSLEGIVSFSTIPLLMSSILGLTFCLIASVWIIWIVVKTLAFGEPVTGYPSLMCAILLIGGVQLLSVGVLGQYISKIHLETKHRPVYIVRETESSGQDEEAIQLS